MDQPENQRWFLHKHEGGSVFGPLSFAQLKEWAETAQIAPQDLISTDQAAWMKAPMLPQLGMDWLVELTSERYYGPTTLGAVQEFIRIGEIDSETYVINACDGSRQQILEMAGVFDLSVVPPEPVEVEPLEPRSPDEPVMTSISMDLQDRIRDLEQSLREERRALQEAEERYRDLERRYLELESGRGSEI